MSLNHNKYNGRNQISNPFYTPIEPASNYERNVPGAYSTAQGVEEKSMSSLQRAMYRKTVTPSNVGGYHTSSIQQPYSSYNNNSQYNSSYGNNNYSRRSKRYEKKNYSYSSGHSYTIGGNNTTNPIYNKSVQRKPELQINVHETKPRLKVNPKPQRSEEATVNDAYAEIDSDNNAKYLETIGRLTAKIEQLEKSSVEESMKKNNIEEYKKEIASLKKSNAQLENELKVIQSTPKITIDESYMEEKKEMQEEISQLKNELHQTKKDLNTVVQMLNKMNTNQASMKDLNCKGQEEMMRSMSELKVIENSSEKIENSMKDITSEHMQIIALLSKQLSNMKMINEEQNRFTHCVSKEINIIDGTKNKCSDLEKVFEEQNIALKNSLQLCESINSR